MCCIVSVGNSVRRYKKKKEDHADNCFNEVRKMSKSFGA